MSEWDGKKMGLKEVVCNSRFLILPWLKVQNLASHVMGMVLKRIPGD